MGGWGCASQVGSFAPAWCSFRLIDTLLKVLGVKHATGITLSSSGADAGTRHEKSQTTDNAEREGNRIIARGGWLGGWVGGLVGE